MRWEDEMPEKTIGEMTFDELFNKIFWSVIPICLGAIAYLKWGSSVFKFLLQFLLINCYSYLPHWLSNYLFSIYPK